MKPIGVPISLSPTGPVIIPTPSPLNVYDLRFLVRTSVDGPPAERLLNSVRTNLRELPATIQVIARTDYMVVAARTADRDLLVVLSGIADGVRMAIRESANEPADDQSGKDQPNPLHLHFPIAWAKSPRWTESPLQDSVPAANAEPFLAQLTLVIQGPDGPWLSAVLDQLDLEAERKVAAYAPVHAGARSAQRIQIPGDRSTVLFSLPVPARALGASLATLAIHQFAAGGAGSLLYEEIVLRRPITYSLINVPLHGRGGGLNLLSFSIPSADEMDALDGIQRATEPLSSNSVYSIYSGFSRWLRLGASNPGVLVDLIANLLASVTEPALIGERVQEINDFRPRDILAVLGDAPLATQHLTIFSGTGHR